MTPLRHETRLRAPSVGFLVLVAAVGVMVWFFAWILPQPPDEAQWQQLTRAKAAEHENNWVRAAEARIKAAESAPSKDARIHQLITAGKLFQKSGDKIRGADVMAQAAREAPDDLALQLLAGQAEGEIGQFAGLRRAVRESAIASAEPAITREALHISLFGNLPDRGAVIGEIRKLRHDFPEAHALLREGDSPFVPLGLWRDGWSVGRRGSFALRNGPGTIHVQLFVPDEVPFPVTLTVEGPQGTQVLTRTERGAEDLLLPLPVPAEAWVAYTVTCDKTFVAKEARHRTLAVQLRVREVDRP